MKHIPNIMSAMRLALCPVFVWVFFKYSPEYSFAVFVAASLLDVFDGFLARKLDAISDLGKILDPVADKALQLSAVICFTIKRMIPVAIILILGIKELILLIGGGIISKKRNMVVYSNKFGKLASFCTSFSLCMLFFANKLNQQAATAVQCILYASVVLSVIAMIQYAYITFKGKNK